MPNNTNRLSVAALAAEVATGPLTVELAPGVEVNFRQLDALTGDAVENMVTAMATLEDGNLDPSRLDSMAAILRALNTITREALDADDRATWIRARVPVKAQMVIMEALLVFYAGAGSLGEGDA